MKNASNNEFIPSDYIMSSIDMAIAIDADHEEFCIMISDYMKPEVIRQGCAYPATVPFGDSVMHMYLFDMNAVLEICESIGDVDDNPDAGRVILQRFFKLAYRCETILSDIYAYIAKQIQYDQISRNEFLNKIWSCVNNSDI